MLVCVVTPAWAADKIGVYEVYGGVGTASCGSWTKFRKGGGIRTTQLSSWLNGFLISYNAFTPGVSDIAKGIDIDGREAWVDNYCSQSPLKPISSAAFALILHLKSR